MNNEGSNEKQPIFIQFNNFFINLFDTYFKEDLKKYEILEKYEIQSVYAYLQQELTLISMRTLIRELHIHKNAKKLAGKTSEERFTYFEKIIETEEFRAYLFKKYEMLEPLIHRKVKQTSSYVAQIIGNFFKDKEELEVIFNAEFNTFEDIILGSGDTHNGGKTVAIIKGKFGKIVYKPHHLCADTLFTNVVNFINKEDAIKHKLNTLKILNKDFYGWQQFIEFKECTEEKGVERYYYRCGVALAIFYILGTSDMHYENIIVNGEIPYFIDLETLVSLNDNRQNISVFRNSVFSTGYIPFNIDMIDVDMSGLCSKSKDSKKIKATYFENYKTDEIYIKTKLATLPASKNNILLNGKYVNIEDFASCVITGFSHVLNFIKNNKEEYKEVLEKSLSDKMSLRQLCRHTYVYAKFLDASVHPNYLITKEEFNGLFQILIKNCKEEKELKRVNNEVQTLINGDVPFYYSKFNFKHLYSNEEIISKDYFTKTTKEVLFSKVDMLTLEEIILQINFIKMSLFLAYEEPFKGNYKALKPLKEKNKEEFINTLALNMTNNIFEEDTNNQKYMYINKLNENEETELSFLDYSLYEGGGLIWFLACVGQEVKNESYINDALTLLDLSYLLYKSEKEKEGIKLAAFSGIGSCLYLYYNMSNLLNDTKLYSIYIEELQYLDNMGFETLKGNSSINSFDFLGGISGLITLLCKIYLQTKKVQEKSTIKNIINKLSVHFYNFFHNYNLQEVGLAHGLCGISLTAALLYKVTADIKYIDMSFKYLQQENQLIKFEGITNETKWCRGASGMALARIEIIKYLQDTEIDTSIAKDNLKLYIQKTATEGIYSMSNCNLCHGIYGNIDVLNTITKDKNYTDIISYKQLNEIASKFIGEENNVDLGLKGNFQLQTFMLGTVGVGYSMLRLQNRNLPSVISLEIIKETIS